MPRPIGVTNSFTSGELSPTAFGRTDLGKWNAGLTCGRNVLVAPLGGSIRRPGLRFVCETKYSQFVSRVIDFQPTETSSYIIESGCQYLRFFKNNAILQDSSDLVVNGGFDSGLTGWTTPTTGSGTATNVGGTMVLDSSISPSSANALQDVTVVIGQTYTVLFQAAGVVGTPAFSLGSTSGGNQYAAGTLTNVSANYTITATTALLSIGFQTIFVGFGTAQHVVIDNVSARTANPLQVATPYDHAQVFTIGTVQSADEQYWLQGCNKSNKLQRFGDTCWKFVEVAFTPPPSVLYGDRPATEVQAGALTGNGVTFTAFNGPTFLAADVGREIQMISGPNAGSRAGIKSVTNSLVVVANICVPFLNTGVNCHGTWKINASPLTGCKPAAKSPVGLSTTLTLDAAGWRGVTFTTSTDCGKFVSINGGSIEITCVTSTTIARGVIRGELSGVTKAESGAWSLEESLWSCVRGYASTGDFKDDRLWLNAGFRFVGSKTGDYEDFGTGVLDDDAVIFGINSKSINAIRHIVAGRALQIFTVGGEFVAKGGTDTPISPTNIQVSPETKAGASTVAPIQANESTLFLSRFGRHLHEFVIPKDQVSEAYSAPDLLLLAEHLTAQYGIVDLAFQREPSPIIWAVRSDGLLLSCSYRRDENVVAWTSHQTCGAFESVAVIPHPDGDREQVWFIVRRTLTSGTKRYVEYLDDSTLVYDRRLTDASVTYNNCVPVTVFTGLDHLECERVQIQADGHYVGTCVVAQGRVGIVTAASRVEIGLPYVSEMITLPPELSLGGQSLQPMQKRWVSLFARTKDSCGLLWRTALGQYECLPTGNLIGPGIRDHVTKGRLADFHDARQWVKQDSPLPMHVLMVGGVMDVGDA